MSEFNGFPHGKFLRLPIPPTFFSGLLHQIDDLAELKVTLFCFHALSQREKGAPYLRWNHFLENTPLVEGVGGELALQHGIDKAVVRGTLLTAIVVLETGEETLYFVNTPKGRTAIEQIQRGNWRPSSAELGVEILPERPNAYTLYEQNIGILTPLIADELRDAEKEFPQRWLEDAIKIAVENNKRNWKYVRGILNRWKKEGRTDEITSRPDLQDGKQYASGKYADFIES